MNQKTTWWSIVALALAGFGTGYLLQMMLSATGQPALQLPYSLPVTLLALTGVLLGFAIWLKRAVAGKGNARVLPQRAVATVAAAKAAIVTGAFYAGFAKGILLFGLLRTVPVGLDAVLPSALSIVAGVLLVVVGLLAEHWGRVPPPKTDPGAEAEVAGS